MMMNKMRHVGSAFYRQQKLQITRRWVSSSSGRPHGSNNRIPPYVIAIPVGTLGITGYIYYAYQEEVPITHRKRFLATSPRWEASLGDQEYKNLLAEFKKKGQVLPKDHRASRTVQRVGSRIAQAAQTFNKDHELAHISASPFTYTVIKSDMANAFVLPNNHVFVFTGLFKYIQTEDDLAAVLGHECAHNLARHVGERLSSSLITNLLGRLTLIIDPSGSLLTVFMPTAKLFRDLPHSRTQETEADQIGVFLAAQACYDPRAAKRVFAAMKKDAAEHGNPPEFLSTHPSHESRITNFDQWLPDALKLYEADAGGRCRQVRQQMQLARKQAAREAAMREGKQQQQQQQQQEYQ